MTAKIPLTRSQQFALSGLVFLLAFVGVFALGLALIALTSP